MAGPATLWKGRIHFGDIAVPVKLHSAVKDERIAFHLLHERDGARLRQQMFCAYEDRPVAAEEQVKGYELEKGKYLLIDPEELEKTAFEPDRTIHVHEFVSAGSIDPLYLDRAYLLEPDGPASGYAALASALQQLGAAGICTWTMRKRAYFGALQVRGSVLRLNTLRHADEVVPAASLGLPDAVMSEKELAIGTRLIEQMTSLFQHGNYGNEHHRKLRAMIDRKVRGEAIALAPARPLEPTEPDRLLEALEASLKKAA